MPDKNYSAKNTYNNEQFAKTLETFLAYTRSENLLLGELEQPPLFFNASPVQDLIAFGAENPESLPQLMAALAQIKEMSIYRGALVGYLIGLYGEKGFADAQTDMALAEFYLHTLDLAGEYLWLACKYLGIEPAQLIDAPAEATDADFERRGELIERIKKLPPDVAAFHQPDNMLAWCGLSLLSYGMMSRLAASRSLRDYFRAHNENDRLLGMCSLLAEWHEAVGFIPYMLDLQEEALALVISPAARRGVEIKLREIDSNNLLFTLLQFALYHQNLLPALGAAEFNYQPVIEKIAKHEPLEETEWPDSVYEQGALGYYNWRALRPDGSFDDMQAVWGEGAFREIPQLNGQTLILVGAPQILRSWGEAFVAGTHKNLRPSVEIRRELEPEEVRSWLSAIRQTWQ